MEVNVINFELKFYPSMTEGVKDRRYKTGYRELPGPIVNVAVNLYVTNPRNELRIREHIITQLGDKYLVTNIDNTNQTAILTATRLQGNLSHLSLETKPLLLIRLGVSVGEGSAKP